MECSHEKGDQDTTNFGCGGGYPLIAYQHFVDRGIVTGGEYGSGFGCKPYFLECNFERKDCPDLNLDFTCQTTCENIFDPNIPSDPSINQ